MDTLLLNNLHMINSPRVDKTANSPLASGLGSAAVVLNGRVEIRSCIAPPLLAASTLKSTVHKDTYNESIDRLVMRLKTLTDGANRCRGTVA